MKTISWKANSQAGCRPFNYTSHPVGTYVGGPQQQQRGAQAQGVDAAQDEGHQEEQDAPGLGEHGQQAGEHPHRHPQQHVPERGQGAWGHEHMNRHRGRGA